MPKENTHLYFIHTLLPQLSNQKLRLLIEKNIPFFRLGSVTPDVFFYSKKEAVAYVSDLLHGEDGRRTNDIPLKLLGYAKDKKDEDTLAFAMGYTTHCALDMTFHPVIYFLTGDYYDDNEKKRFRAVYKHRYLETLIDKLRNEFYFVDELLGNIKTDNIAALDIISSEFKLSRFDVNKVFKRFISSNEKFRKTSSFRLVSNLARVERLQLQLILPLFYDNLTKSKTGYAEELSFEKLRHNENFRKTLDDLFVKAYRTAEEMLNAACDYYLGVISEEECRAAIPGTNLNSGKTDVLPSELRYGIED